MTVSAVRRLVLVCVCDLACGGGRSANRDGPVDQPGAEPPLDMPVDAQSDIGKESPGDSAADGAAELSPETPDAPPADSACGSNPAEACRTSPGDCIPSSCGCTPSGWACTADCGGGRDCGDGGSDTSGESKPAACSCSGGCGSTEECLEFSGGGLGPDGPVCSAPTGLRQCRKKCVPGPPDCPADRPYCRSVPVTAGCCSDAIASTPLCCANSDATSVETCL